MDWATKFPELENLYQILKSRIEWFLSEPITNLQSYEQIYSEEYLKALHIFYQVEDYTEWAERFQAVRNMEKAIQTYCSNELMKKMREAVDATLARIPSRL